MAFTAQYLERCWKGRGRWRGKQTYPGDWYLAGDPPQLHVVGEAEVAQVDFHSADIAFVPDTDDLLELINHQIRASGGDPAKKSLTIQCDSAGVWSLIIEYGNRRTGVARQESIHSLLLYALYQMAVPIL